MKVQVGIPTYGNNGTTIKLTLDALLKQTYKEFEVIIVYKHSPEDKYTLDVLEKYSKLLNIKIIEQHDGKIEEAMNLIYSNANADILLTLDDDNIPHQDWIKDHINYHIMYPRVGAIRGKIIHKFASKPQRGLKLYLKKLLKRYVYRPYSHEFDEYYGYLTIFGVPTDKEYKSREDVEFVKTITLAAENMSVKREVYADFRLPCYSLRGFHHEDLLALHAIRKGFSTIELKKSGINTEIEREDYGVSRESLSTPTSIKGKLELIAEHFLFPYGANFFGFKPRFLQLLEFLIALSYSGIEKATALSGIRLAKLGIYNKLQPKEIREELEKGINSLLNRANL